VRVAADAVQDHPGEAHPGLQLLAAEHHRRGGRAHAEDIQHQQDGCLERAGDRGGARVLRAADAVEQAHHAFDHRQVAVARAPTQHAQQGRFGQEPRVQVAGGSAGGDGVERRIDVVRA
jgi:hypothetical protein